MARFTKIGTYSSGRAERPRKSLRLAVLITRASPDCPRARGGHNRGVPILTNRVSPTSWLRSGDATARPGARSDCLGRRRSAEPSWTRGSRARGPPGDHRACSAARRHGEGQRRPRQTTSGGGSWGQRPLDIMPGTYSKHLAGNVATLLAHRAGNVATGLAAKHLNGLI